MTRKEKVISVQQACTELQDAILDLGGEAVRIRRGIELLSSRQQRAFVNKAMLTRRFSVAITKRDEINGALAKLELLLAQDVED